MRYRYISGLTASGLDYLQRANGSGDSRVYFGSMCYMLHNLDVFMLQHQFGLVLEPM